MSGQALPNMVYCSQIKNKRVHEKEMKMNTITNWQYDKKSNLGHITVNNYRVSLSRECVGYKANLETPIFRYRVRVANDWNMSSLFILESAQIRGLISKIKRHPYRLVR